MLSCAHAKKSIMFPTNGKTRGPGMSARVVEITLRTIRKNNVRTRNVERSICLAKEAPVVHSEKLQNPSE